MRTGSGLQIIAGVVEGLVAGLVAVAVAVAAGAGCRAPCACPESPAGAAAGAPRERYPELYGAGLFTTSAWDFFLAFSPDQRRVLFGRADDAFEKFALLETRLGDGGRWSTPVTPRFAQRWSNADPHISPDGRSVYFISNRPNPGDANQTDERASYDVWVARLDAAGEWGDAERVPAPVSDPDRDEWSPAIAANGNLYFGGDRPGSRGGSDLWVSRLAGGVYQAPENLGDAINSSMHELEPWIAPDERYLVFSALRRPDGTGRYDLFISRREGGAWTPAVALRGGVNSTQSDYNHSVTPDGEWLYFSSTRAHAGPLGERLDQPRDDASVRGVGDGKGDIYRIPARLAGIE